MAANLYYSPLPFTATGGGPLTAGYPVTNIESPRIRKSWRGNVIAPFNNVYCDMGSSMSIKSVLVQDCNIAAAVIWTAGADQIYSNLGAMAFSTDPSGRRRGLFSIPGSARYVLISVTDGTPTDGASQWSIGAVYLFGEKVEPLPRNVDFGVDLSTTIPSEEHALPNGRYDIAELGPSYAEVDVDIADLWTTSTDMMAIWRALNSGTICLQLGYHGWDFWPLQRARPETSMRFADLGVDRFSLRLREVV